MKLRVPSLKGLMIKQLISRRKKHMRVTIGDTDREQVWKQEKQIGRIRSHQLSHPSSWQT